MADAAGCKHATSIGVYIFVPLLIFMPTIGKWILCYEFLGIFDIFTYDLFYIYFRSIKSRMD